MDRTKMPEMCYNTGEQNIGYAKPQATSGLRGFCFENVLFFHYLFLSNPGGGRVPALATTKPLYLCGFQTGRQIGLGPGEAEYYGRKW